MKTLIQRIKIPVGIGMIAIVLSVSISGSLRASADTLPLTSQLHVGSRGTEVSKLQTFLATNPYIYPQGTVSGYYGPLTQAAVVQFQLNYGLPPVGAVGPLTLARINGIINSGLGLDISAPTIGSVSAVTTGTTETIYWSTDEDAQGKVFYSPAPLQMTEASGNFLAPYISGSVAQTNNLYGKSQGVALSGLTHNTTYYYVVMATDRSSNVSVTTQGTFRIN
jgi:peptidoglycan hydrolase-like protein with peptidoglycan-binding domain